MPIKNQNNKPDDNELPSDFADRIGLFYSKQATLQHKKENGQYFTPTAIARLMAAFSKSDKQHLKILDPGCGTAVLSCSLIEHLIKHNSKLKSVKLIAYETDCDLIPYTQKALTHLKAWLKTKNISFTYLLYARDFVTDNASALRHKKSDIFDVVISNPPYFKLAKDDKKAIAAKELVSGQPNIYALFMGIAAKLLNKNGELIFITPRSFASGNYFKAFRELFFNSVQLDTIHLFNSRKDTFTRDSILQETVIIKAVNEALDPRKQVIVSSGTGIKDISKPAMKKFLSGELIDMGSKEKILHLPTNDKEEALLRLVSTWENKLTDHDIQISTGPVVSFRALKYIQSNYENGIVFLAPLFWLHNVQKMFLEWPKAFKDKGQYIKIESESKSLLIPNKNYIFLRRFSTKDDKSRLIAAPYFCNYQKSNSIGVENKVNYIYRKHGHLERSEVAGLCALLNSELFDTYFQIFNGNVNVSATELREMRFPKLLEVKEIGNKIIISNDYSMNNVNTIINDYFETNLLLTHK